MHEVSDALAERQASAQRLSRVCAGVAKIRIAPADPATMSLRQLYDDDAEAPVPDRLWATLAQLGRADAAAGDTVGGDDAALA